MKLIHPIMAILLAGSGLAMAAPAPTAPAGAGVEQRLERVERLLDSQTLVDMLGRLDQLQREVQQLRGDLEERTHTVDELKRRQRDLYLDLDRRLSRLEREGVPAPAAAAKAAAPAAKQSAPAPTANATAVNDSGLMGDKGAVVVAKPAAADNAAAKADATTSVTEQVAEREAYQKAFDMLRELRYGQAITAFGSFLKAYPHGRYAHIAQYWLGEANYAQRDFKAAIKEYQQLIDSFPNSPKLAEAMLKIGYSHYELGDKDAARKVLNQLMNRYSGSTEAGQARNLLKKLDSE